MALYVNIPTSNIGVSVNQAYAKINIFNKLLFIISLFDIIKKDPNKTNEGINKGITILSFSSPTILIKCKSFLF